MAIKFNSNLKSLLEADREDIVLFMNNSVGDWSSSKAQLLALFYPKSRKEDKCKQSTKSAMLGRISTPVKENNKATAFINVHTRRSDRTLTGDDEIKNLNTALSFLSTVLFYKKILIVPGPKTDIKGLQKYCNKELAGNDITIASRKPE